MTDRMDENPAAALVETHVSVLVFVGDRVYKLKKPVHFDFLDFSTREARLEGCRKEVELNRRLAPDVYLGVTDVVGPDGEVCDHLVTMRRLPAERRLARLVVERDTTVGEQIDRVAARLARFHADAVRGPEIDAAATPDALVDLWDRNQAGLRAAAGGLVDPARLDEVDGLARRFLAGRGPLLSSRLASGAICDGHGDLQAEDIFCLDDGPRLLDCIDFDDRLRFGDVVSDLAFLVMDLERLGAPDLGGRLVDRYERTTRLPLPRALLDFYIAYRACVRAKVQCLRAEEHLDPTVDPAALVDLAQRHLARATPVLVLVGGLPGTGKSTLAAALAPRIDAVRRSSDERRKRLAGLEPSAPHPAPFGEGIYDRATTDRVYDSLLAAAGEDLAMGRSVVLDASWTAARHRAAARRVAGAALASLVEVRCTVPLDVAAERIASRRAEGPAVSDATEQVAGAMAVNADPWPEAHELDTSADVDATSRAAAALVDRWLVPPWQHRRS